MPHIYFRRLRLQEFFLDTEKNPDRSAFRPPSTWMPPKDKNQTLETNVKAIRGDTERLLTAAAKRQTKNNLTQEERLTLKKL